jgi:protein-disulfide isomerase
MNHFVEPHFVEPTNKKAIALSTEKSTEKSTVKSATRLATFVLLLVLLAATLISCIRPTTNIATDAAVVQAEPATASAVPTVAPSAAPKAQVPAPTGTYKDLPVGFTAEGYPYRGSPDAPITMYEYSDYQCPFCSRYFVQTEPVIDESYVRTGKVRVVFRDMPLAALHPNAPAAALAANCVMDEGAVRFWQMHAKLFQTQSEWESLADTNEYFTKLVTEIGGDVTKYAACITGGSKQAQVDIALQEANDHGFNGTPSFNVTREATAEAFPLVGAQPFDQFASLIDTLIAGGTPQTAQADPAQAQGNSGQGEIPFWATADGLKLDDAHPGLDMAGDFVRGNPAAKVIVIEFSDFQCPFCQRHKTETEPTLDKNFVATDKVLWVFKHFPLNIHPQAEPAAVAAECAADQGKFWEMNDLLFSTVAQWSLSEPNPVFGELAKQLGLDTSKFDTCLTAGDALKRVQSDMSDGAPFVQGTPTFILLTPDGGKIIPGALPVDRFVTVIQEALDAVKQ